MKRLFSIFLFCLVIFATSCAKKNCMDCTGCNSMTDATICEEDFENTSEFNNQIEVYTLDGCACLTK